MRYNIKPLLMSLAISALLLSGSRPDGYTISHCNQNDIRIPASYQSSYGNVGSEVQMSYKCSPATLYDTFTSKEISMIEATVQHEVGGLSREYKKLIAELIYNRIISDEFPNTVEGVLFRKGQFAGIDRWYSPQYEVDSETRDVVKEVFSGSETTHCALYYYNPELSSYQSVMWFESSGDIEYLFEYSETSWNVTYTTRFFK